MGLGAWACIWTGVDAFHRGCTWNLGPSVAAVGFRGGMAARQDALK